MTSRTARFLLPVLVFALASCSKTQDSAPERRLFGDPPVIVSVNDTEFFNPQASIDCDFTQTVAEQLCDLTKIDTDGDGKGDVEAVSPGSVVFDNGGVFGRGIYSEAVLRVQVKDPNSTTDQSNILMVAASYLEEGDPPSEVSLVLFDDGSDKHFDNPQKTSGNPLFCDTDPVLQVCRCQLATWGVTSGDDKAGDGIFYRKLAIVGNKTNSFLEDCIMRDRKENIFAREQSNYTFTIEAVDRQGNLATWPNKLNVSRQETAFECTGDVCGCCWLIHNGLQQECSGLDGMRVPGFADDGICHLI